MCYALNCKECTIVEYPMYLRKNYYLCKIKEIEMAIKCFNWHIEQGYGNGGRCQERKISVAGVFIFLFCAVPTFLYSQQSFNMSTGGHSEVVSDYCVIYDDGGATQNHSPRVNSTYTIRASNPQYRYKILIRAEFQQCNEAKAVVKIKSGEADSENILYSASCYDNYIFYADSDVISLEFHADDDNPSPGFRVELTAVDCAPVTNINYQYLDSTTVVLRWEGNYTEYTIDYFETAYPYSGNYDLANGQNNIQTVSTNADSVVINVLPNISLCYHIYGTCNGLPSYGIIDAVCPNVIPENFIYEQRADSMYIEWDDEPNVNWYMRHNWGDWQPATNPLVIENNCEQYNDYIVVGTYGSAPQSDCNYAEAYFWSECEEVYSFNIRSVSDSSVTLWWQDNPETQQYVIGYHESSSGTVIYYDTIVSGVQQCTVYGLEQATEYTFWIFSVCDDCGLSSGYSVITTTNLNNCLDFTNIRGLNTYLTWGTYENPYSDTTYNNYRLYGNNDYFYGSERHTVCVDTNAHDWNTNGQLKKIPSGEKASVMLGNSDVGAQAESISYEYVVDTNNFDMLILRYAVVLQDPDHDLSNQPRFTLEILDENNELIDSTCGMADFYASGDLGWNVVSGNNSNTIWKDWTTIGIDIAPYHETTIRVRLTTYDCQEGGHYGYAYFTLNCDNKRIYLVNRCDAEDSVHLVAPLGFDYKWYRGSETTPLSTNHEITVPIDSNSYFCRASFVDKPECYFIISSVAINVAPHSHLTYSIDSCKSEISFTDSSFFDFDTSYGVFTNQFLSDSFWILDGERIDDSSTITRYYPDNGEYEIQLVSTLSDSYCVDTLRFPIDINFNAAHISAPDTICRFDTLSLIAETNPDITLQNPTYEWNTGDTSQMVTFSADQSAQYTLRVKDNGFCKGFAKKSVVVPPAYYDTIYAEICQGETYNANSFTANATGIYVNNNLTATGCDSLTALVLTVHPTYDTVFFDTLCMGQSYNFHGANLTQTGSYTDTLQTLYGCDSIVTLNLYFLPVHEQTITAQICQGQVYELNGFSESSTGLYTQELQNIYGCDSTVHLFLEVNPVYDYTINAEICYGETYAQNGFNEIETGSYTQFLQSQFGCDSTVTLDLIVNPVYNDTIFAQLCGEVYDNYDFYEHETGIYTRNLQTANGCDSLVTLNLTLWIPFVDTINDVIYRGTTYEGYGFTESEEGEYVRVYTDMHGCDSTYILDLQVIKLLFPNMVSANGDGVNEVFEIHGLIDSDFYSESSLIIKTRHGRTVYRKDNIKNYEDFWSPAQTNSPSGTYFYNFRAKGRTHDVDFNGTIEVFR